MKPGEKWQLQGRSIEMIQVNHIVPGVGYRVENDTSVFAFSGDTSSNDNFWQVLNKYDRLDLLIVETAFTNSEINLCRQAGHYCASLLAEDLKKLRHKPRIYISHNKPGFEKQILTECAESIQGREVYSLNGGTHFQL
jgi:ribonuclease BN (tRNA processing enzyme)